MLLVSPPVGNQSPEHLLLLSRGADRDTRRNFVLVYQVDDIGTWKEVGLPWQWRWAQELQTPHLHDHGFQAFT